MPCDAKFSEKWQCSQHNNTALIKQMFPFDTAVVTTKLIRRGEVCWISLWTPLVDEEEGSAPSLDAPVTQEGG